MAQNDKYDEMMQRIKWTVQKPIQPDTRVIDVHNQIMANTAYEMQQAQQEMYVQLQGIAERNAKNDEAIRRTAQESVAHTKLLEQQLREVQTQNELLRTEAEDNRAEVEESCKATKKANRLSILAIVLSTVLSIGGIVASILIALYL